LEKNQSKFLTSKSSVFHQPDTGLKIARMKVETSKKGLSNKKTPCFAENMGKNYKPCYSPTS